MADQQVDADGGDDAPVRRGSNGAAPKLTHEQQLAADRAAFLADEGDSEGEGNDAGDAAAAKKKPAKKAEIEEDADLDDEDEKDDDADVEESADEDEDADESDQDDDSDLDEDDEEKPDADTAKRLEKIRRTEQRAREQITRERADFTREREAFVQEWKPKIEKAERFEALAARAKIDATSVMRELGLNDEDLEFAAHDLYANSKKGAEDPKRRAAVAASKRERELALEVEKLKKTNEEREERETSTAQQREEQERLDSYIDDVAKATSDKLPLSKKYLEANPKKARAKLVKLANDLTIETGSAPPPQAVMKALEKDRRRALRELGIDPKTLTPAQVAAAANGTLTKKDAKGNAIADKKAAAKAGTNGQKLSFLEQRKADREAFINGDADDDN